MPTITSPAYGYPLTLTSAATETIPLPGTEARAANAAWTSTTAYRVRIGGTWAGSLAVQARIAGSSDPWESWEAVPKEGADVATITAAGLYLIDTAGLEVQLVHTRTSGTLELSARPVGV